MRLLILFLLFLSQAVSSQLLAQDAVAIVKKVEEALSPSQVKALYRFTNHRLDGSQSQYEVRLSIRDSRTSHNSFEKPEREKGREVLRLGDDIWSFMPSVGKIVRIADRDSFAGGDFSNADILQGDWLNRYQAKVIKDLPKQWILELDAKTPAATYARMRLWVEKSTGMPVQQNFYDSRGTLLKRCLYGEIKKFGSIERPARLEMQNVITKQKSELEVLDVQKLEHLPESRFIVDNLGK